MSLWSEEVSKNKSKFENNEKICWAAAGDGKGSVDRRGLGFQLADSGINPNAGDYVWTPCCRLTWAIDFCGGRGHNRQELGLLK